MLSQGNWFFRDRLTSYNSCASHDCESVLNHIDFALALFNREGWDARREKGMWWHPIFTWVGDERGAGRAGLASHHLSVESASLARSVPEQDPVRGSLRMSDMLQLSSRLGTLNLRRTGNVMLESSYLDDKLKHIGHSGEAYVSSSTVKMSFSS